MNLSAWLRNLGLERYEPAFRDNEVTPEILPELTDADLRELGLPLGPRKILLKAIASFQGSPPAADEPHLDAPQGASHRSGDERQTPVPQAERRQLTVMFADLIGSTTLSTRLDPEDMREVLRQYQNAVTGEIARVGGHVAKLMGDGVLAYFGWPRAHEDDAERAVQAGLAVAHAVGQLSTPTGDHLAARIGIATGLVVVGDLVGEGAAREEAVVGETPNLASRLQETAPPGSVVIGDGTRQLLGELFEFQELEATQLKGFATPVARFQVLREHATSSRFEAQRSGRGLPMVGRDQELALILERWQQARNGEGQAVLLVGEAGIGKSRLIQATLDALASDEHFPLRCQCSPHHTGTALWPVIQYLTYAAGLGPADPDATKLKKLEALLRYGVKDVIEVAPLIAPLLGIGAASRYPAQDLTSQQRRTRTLAALVAQLLGCARHRPVLVVIEDAHWIDPTTHELLGTALDRIAGARVLMLLTSRPDNQPALGGHPHVTRLTLDRLGRGLTEAIITGLSGARDLSPELLREITARTDGVPLFAEELTRAVLEAGSAGPAAVVPASLHASLMARLDRVPGGKEVAQTAACIGREFSYSLLAAVSPSSEVELRGALNRLAAAELVFVRDEPPDVRYGFKHALVRDTAHESLLRTKRRSLHARIARTLEERFPETVDREPELLAWHYTEAGLGDQAVEYWQRAGHKALAHSAMAEAITQLTKGLEVLERLPDGPERQRRELSLQLALGQASIAAKGFAADGTGRAYARARELCLVLDTVSELLPVLYGRSVFHFQRGELSAAHEVAQELLRLGKAHGDVTAQVTGHRMIAGVLCQLGRFTESRNALEAALALYDSVRDQTLVLAYAIDSRVVCLSWLSHVDLILGHPEQALAHHKEMLAYVRELAHPNTTALGLGWGCIFRQLLRDWHNAQAQAEAVISLATEQGFPLYRATGTVVRGWALAESGRVEDGIAEIRQGLADYAATGAEMWLPYFLALLAEAHGQAGHVTEGLYIIDEALVRVDRTEIRWIEPELHRIRGELLLMHTKPEQQNAEACFHRALAIALEQRASRWELSAKASLARLCQNQAKL